MKKRRLPLFAALVTVAAVAVVAIAAATTFADIAYVPLAGEQPNTPVPVTNTESHVRTAACAIDAERRSTSIRRTAKCSGTSSSRQARGAQRAAAARLRRRRSVTVPDVQDFDSSASVSALVHRHSERRIRSTNFSQQRPWWQPQPVARLLSAGKASPQITTDLRRARARRVTLWSTRRHLTGGFMPPSGAAERSRSRSTVRTTTTALMRSTSNTVDVIWDADGTADPARTTTTTGFLRTAISP